MSRKLVYLTCFVMLFGLVCNAMGQTGTGLRAEYYLFSGSTPPPRETCFTDLFATRIDPQIYMYWNPGFQTNHPDGLTPALYIYPPEGLRADTFSVRWSGEIQALKSEAYTFITGSDDGVRMWLNGELIIDAWADQDRAENSSDPVQLTAGKRYPIVVEGYENGGEAEWQLYWQSQSTARQVVPQNVLYPAVKAQDYPASKPIPADGAVLKDTWVSMEWTKGPAAVTHDVYLGDNYDDVSAGSPDVFQGNQASTNFVIGFPGFPYPDGLVLGTTYYWRIDEVNDAHPDSPWKGPVWSFTVAPKTAFGPNPADGGEDVDVDDRLTWQSGFGAKLHFVYFGDDYDTVNNAAAAPPTGLLFYSPPGGMEAAKVYYWRVDEFDGFETHKGDVWSFTTTAAVGSPNPAYGATNVSHTQPLSWVAGDFATSHEVYFGTDKDAVRNATKSSPEYQGPKDLGSESFDPGLLEWDTDYYWRIDEVNDANANSPWKGNVWTFTTANFFVVDDLESYNNIDPPNPLSNTIFSGWPDGYGIDTNGALVGNDLPPYAETDMVHSGMQAMPYSYDANLKYAEATHTITYPRDWTEKGADRLVIWFKGDWINVAVPMYVAIANTTGSPAVVNHDNPEAARIDVWTEWVIPLQAFADQGVDLTDVNTISIGFGNKANPQAGGSGKVVFDDIRLYTAPAE